jgi:hypothetical protein
MRTSAKDRRGVVVLTRDKGGVRSEGKLGPHTDTTIEQTVAKHLNNRRQRRQRKLLLQAITVRTKRIV